MARPTQGIVDVAFFCLALGFVAPVASPVAGVV